MVKNREMIARSSEQYAGAQGQSTMQRNGEEILWSHNLSHAFIGMIRKLYHRSGGVARGTGTFSRGRDGRVETRTATATVKSGRCYLIEFLEFQETQAHFRTLIDQ